MPIVFGFSNHRKNLLEKELSKFSTESKQLGAKSLGVFGDYPLGNVLPDTSLDLLIIQETDEMFHNRDEFWITHLRPSVHTRFFVYTPEEYEDLRNNNFTILNDSIKIIDQINSNHILSHTAKDYEIKMLQDSINMQYLKHRISESELNIAMKYFNISIITILEMKF